MKPTHSPTCCVYICFGLFWQDPNLSMLLRKYDMAVWDAHLVLCMHVLKNCSSIRWLDRNEREMQIESSARNRFCGFTMTIFFDDLVNCNRNLIESAHWLLMECATTIILSEMPSSSYRLFLCCIHDQCGDLFKAANSNEFLEWNLSYPVG